MMNNENYINIINLLKQALLFYSKKDNYVKNNISLSNVEKDEGFQARFTLEKINEMSDYLDVYDYFNELERNDDGDFDNNKLNEIIAKFNKWMK